MKCLKELVIDLKRELNDERSTALRHSSKAHWTHRAVHPTATRSSKRANHSYGIWFTSHGRRTWILSLRQEHKLKVCDDKVPNKTSVPNYFTRNATIIFSTTTLLHAFHYLLNQLSTRVKKTEYRVLPENQLIFWKAPYCQFATKYYYRDYMKGKNNTHQWHKNAHQILVKEQKANNHSGHLHTDYIILRRLLNKSYETGLRYIFKHQAINTDGAVEAQLQSFSVWTLNRDVCRFSSPGLFNCRKSLPLTAWYEACWAKSPAKLIWRVGKSLSLWGIEHRLTSRPACSIVSLVTLSKPLAWDTKT
jgi:hypothetical protein